MADPVNQPEPPLPPDGDDLVADSLPGSDASDAPEPSSDAKPNSKAKRPKAPRKPIPNSVRTAIYGVVTIGMLVGSAAALYFYKFDLEQHAAEKTRRPLDIRMNWPVIAADGESPTAGATWLDRPTQLELVGLIKASLSQNPLDADSMKATRKALMATGWFTNIDFIRRYQSGIIHISAQWHQPVAAVRWGLANASRDYVVSSAGTLMPLDFAPGKSGLPLLIGPSSPLPLSPGELWVGGDVQAGIALHAVIQQVDSIAEQVKAVDISRYQGDRKLALVTTQGNRITWGSAPGDFAPGERSPLVKLGWLLKLRQAAEYGYRIDAGRHRLDLSLPVGVMAERSDSTGGGDPLGLPNGEPGAMVSQPDDTDLPHSAFVQVGDHRLRASDLAKLAGSLPPGAFVHEDTPSSLPQSRDPAADPPGDQEAGD